MKADLKKDYLVCEQKTIYALLMASAGMMGAYTYVLRGGVFCNAQTANVVVMAISFGKGDWLGGLYFLIPISAYLLGAFVSEILPSPVRKLGFLRFDTCLIIFETVVLLIIGFIPLSVPHQVVQVIVNFITSMQYNTFRQAEGIPMATTFCTNHIRQIGVGLAKAVGKKDGVAMRRGLIHAGMVSAFFSGAAVLTFLCPLLEERAVWVVLLPMGFVLVKLIRADLGAERDMLDRKPSGH
ncbi:YoaK family protein [Acutalibacter sp. 1XD8-36]|uniref:YoaK family protein n=1 Tax=Acutalibacter sp. 1XD8-36 TaxID=2320852 RepID=UPI00261848D9|nr:YoaK family protein [Acutalibacter sp. 1XD8-36]